MAVTFDPQKDLTKVERYDQGVPETILLTKSNFDIFDLGAEVGDSMCFGWGAYNSGRPWHNLYLSISTPLDIDATLTWYYKEGSSWTALIITADGTNGFTQSGLIEFDCPPRMIQATTNPGYLTFAVKCEITAFTSITTVGHVNATPQINDFTIIVTGTETMTSIKAANDSGSWGVVDQDGDRFKIWSNFELQGNLTSLDELVEIGDDNVGRMGATSSASVLQLGEEVSGRSTNGSVWRLTNHTGAYPYSYFRGTLKMYVSEFYHDSPSGRDFNFTSTTVLDFNDSTFRIQKDRNLVGDVTITNSILQASDAPRRFMVGAGTMVFDNAKFLITDLWGVINNSFTIENTDLSASYLIVRPYGLGATITMVDCDLGDDFNAKIVPYRNGIGIVQYNLNLTIQDDAGNPISTPNLRIVDDYATVIYDATYSGGDILLQVYKEIAVYLDPTEYFIYNPFTITISKDGYQDYVEVVEIIDRFEKTVSLQDEPLPTDSGTVLYGSTLHNSIIQ